ncbi:MAG: cytochrome c [Acidobacteriota bacterium]
MSLHGLILLTVLLWCRVAAAQSEATLKLETGKQVFEAACAGCHGMDGKGQPVSTLGFEPPATFPDFTDCNGSTRESTQQWSSVIHDGGKVRAFAPIMPSFGDASAPALTDQQIQNVIGHIRKFCTEDSHWPSGDFNFARPMFTEKSFPEDELVLMTTFNTNGQPGIVNNMIVEKRFGAIFNMETRFRGGFSKTAAGSWTGAVGDTSFEFKRSMWVHNKTGSMLAWGNEMIIPTGDPNRGSGGNGMFMLESFLSYGQILPKSSFLQAQVGVEAPPFHRHQNPMEVYWRTDIGKAFNQSRGFGRSWTLALETVGVRSLGPNNRLTVDLVPQMQVTLSKRQHMRLGMGYNVPTVNIGNRPQQFMFYLLWDTFDGGLKEGWK